MEQPTRLVQDHNVRFVCELKKSLYGLKHAKKMVQEVDSFMVRQVLQEVIITIVIMVYSLFWCLYVDNMFFANKIMVKYNRLAQLARIFDMKDLGQGKC